jgi:hypothetical protein
MKLRLLSALVSSFALMSVSALAAPIPISGYDINDAVLSGHGNWFHTYTGTITPGVNFVNQSNAGTTALYNGGGNGTLTDPSSGTSPSNTQLFVTPAATDGTPINPEIFFTLPFAYDVNTIDLFEGTFSGVNACNAIPGSLTGVTVTLLGPGGTRSQALSLSPFGLNNCSTSRLVNGALDLTTTSLDNFPAFAVFLSDFQGTLDNWFSLAQVTIDGDLATTDVPEPATLVLLGGSLVGLGLMRRRRKTVLINRSSPQYRRAP